MLALAATLALASVGVAQDSPFLRCTGIADDAERLTCFDLTAATMATPLDQAVPAAAPSPVAPPRAVAAPAEAPRAPPAPDERPPVPAAEPPAEARGRFGLRERRDETDSQTLRIAELSLDRAGKLIVRLADGQVWRQVSGDTTAMRVPRGNAVQTATIRRATFGSYRMRIEPLGRTVRVKRVE